MEGVGEFMCATWSLSESASVVDILDRRYGHGSGNNEAKAHLFFDATSPMSSLRCHLHVCLLKSEITDHLPFEIALRTQSVIILASPTVAMCTVHVA